MKKIIFTFVTLLLSVSPALGYPVFQDDEDLSILDKMPSIPACETDGGVDYFTVKYDCEGMSGMTIDFHCRNENRHIRHVPFSSPITCKKWNLKAVRS